MVHAKNTNLTALAMGRSAGTSGRIDALSGRVDTLSAEVATIKQSMLSLNDVRSIVAEELEPIHQKIENLTGYRREIDHVIDSLAAILKRMTAEAA